MKKLWLALMTLIALAAARPSSACELFYRTTFPTLEGVRLTGTVVGYVAIPAMPSVDISPMGADLPAAGLRLAVREIVSGPVTGTETIVALFPYHSDCKSTPATRAMLERDYPVGSQVAVRGRATGSPGVPIVAENNQRQFVAKIQDDLPRTSQGDLDYEKSAVRTGSVIEFEFDRAILTLTKRRGDEYERLRNIALHRDWDGMPDALARYRQLVADSGLGTREGADLLDRFQQAHPLVK